jgi:flavin reductase (DIM6/NTAB) family NADH-FMN oxidoreductase RutF
VAKRSLPLSRVYGLLEPGPVVLLTTAARGRANVMTLSWHVMLEFEPPTVGIVVSDRNYSYAALARSRECVINVPSVEIGAAVVRCGNLSGRRIDKFARLGLTPEPASCVAPPLIAECYASLECRVIDTRMVRRYSLFVVEVVKAWVERSRRRQRTLHHLGRGRFMIAGDLRRWPSRRR